MGYNWNTERLIKETANYAEGIDNPVDAVLHAGAAAVHLVTGAGDALLGDAVRLVQKEENRVELKEYQGSLARLKLDGSEAVQSIRGTAKGKITSILTLPIVALKTVGDGFADGADAFAGVRHGDLAA